MSKNLIWFRNDLRTRDQRVLHQARDGAQSLLGLYCFDPRQFRETVYGFNKTGKFRARFLLETVADLRRELKALNIPLLVFYAKPEDVIAGVVKEHGVDKLYYQTEWTREELEVSTAVEEGLKGEVSTHQVYDQFLFHPDELPFDSFGDIPEVFTAFRKKCEKQVDVQAEAPAIEPMASSNLLEDMGEIPLLTDLGHAPFETDERTAFPFRGGESAAWKRLEDYFWNKQLLSHYKQTRNGLMGTDYSSKFSAWLANGSISPRTIYHQVKKFEREIKKNSSTYWMVFELIWRDYFKYISLKHGDKIFRKGGIRERDYNWGQDPDLLEQWIQGDTPYSFVNANMNELSTTGWMSNRGRQNVASYWAKELLQDWRTGAAYFESQLIDYDVHSNWGNWMYNSGVGNDPRDRKFNIERQAERYDPDGVYQKLWTS